ncbi:hypothetical protein LBMAG38_10860 [Chloroflexota bacterium]|nr:hypothetical protein LBMAG38_10860 [Chloroflexota bacterium]
MRSAILDIDPRAPEDLTKHRMQAGNFAPARLEFTLESRDLGAKVGQICPKQMCLAARGV